MRTKKNIDRLVCFSKTPLIFALSIYTMDTRERIVNVASRLFYKQGYNSTGINQVIKEAEVAKASLYQYFPSKEDLLVEYLRVTAENTEKSLRAFIDKYSTPEEKALAVFDFILKFSKQADFNGCNFLNIAAEVPVDDARVRQLIRRQKDSIRSLFAGILKPAGKEKLADELYLLFDAALVTGKVHEGSWPVKTAKKMAEKLL